MGGRSPTAAWEGGAPTAAWECVEEPQLSADALGAIQCSCGARRGASNPRRRIAPELVDEGGRSLQTMSGDHLERHLPHSPRLITQRVQDCRFSGVVPGVQQPPCGPHAQPVRRSRRLTGADPVRWWSPERKNQIAVGRSAIQQVDATRNHGGHPALCTYLGNSLPGRLGPMGGPTHLANLDPRPGIAACTGCWGSSLSDVGAALVPSSPA
jgi:hypothetical protein